MEMRASAKKSIEELLQAIVPEELEETKPLRETSNRFDTIFQEYKQALQKMEDRLRFGRIYFYNYDNFKEYYLPPNPDNSLSPVEIDTFLQGTIPYEELRSYPVVTGIFVNTLLQQSYAAGHHHFSLHLPRPLDFLGCNLQGSAEHPLTLDLQGNVEEHLGNHAVWLQCSVQGSIQKATGGVEAFDYFGRLNFGSYAHYSTFQVSGSIDYENLPHDAEHCTFTLGKILSKKDPYVKIPFRSNMLKTKQCLFKSTNEETLQTVAQRITYGNKFVYINPSGKERRWWSIRPLVNSVRVKQELKQESIRRTLNR